MRQVLMFAIAASLLVSCDFSVTDIALDGAVVPTGTSDLEVPLRFTIRNTTHDSSSTGATARKVKLAIVYRQNPGSSGFPFVAPFKIRDAGGATLTPDGTPDASGYTWYYFIDLASLASTGSSVTIAATARVACPAANCDSVSLAVEFDSCRGEEFTEPYCRIQEEDEANNRSPTLEVPVPGLCADDATLERIASSFVDCHAENAVGQSRSVSGVSCEQVCCAFGYSGCAHRGAQADYAACAAPGSVAVGSCSEVFAAAWSSQCICTP